MAKSVVEAAVLQPHNTLEIPWRFFVMRKKYKPETAIFEAKSYVYFFHLK